MKFVVRKMHKQHSNKFLLHMTNISKMFTQTRGSIKDSTPAALEVNGFFEEAKESFQNIKNHSDED